MAQLKAKIIVTGVDGHFGRATANGILKEVGAENLIFTSPKPDVLSTYKDVGADVRLADYNNPETLVEAFQGGERMLLISTPIIGDIRVRWHKNALDAAQKAGVRKIVYTSIVGAGYEDNPALVTIDHRATEKYIMESGMTWNIMRDSQYAEAMTHYALPAALQTGVWYSNQGDGKMAFISRDDCVTTAIALLLNKGEDNVVYDVTGPELLTYEQVARMATEITGKPIRMINVTDAEMFATWIKIGVPPNMEKGMAGSPVPWSADDMTSFGQAIREGFMNACSDHVEKLTGKKPKTMRELIKEASVNWEF